VWTQKGWMWSNLRGWLVSFDELHGMSWSTSTGMTACSFGIFISIEIFIYWSVSEIFISFNYLIYFFSFLFFSWCVYLFIIVVIRSFIYLFLLSAFLTLVCMCGGIQVWHAIDSFPHQWQHHARGAGSFAMRQERMWRWLYGGTAFRWRRMRCAG
jgi:hypothetical protein